MAQTHLKMAQTHLKLKMAQNGSNSSQNGSNSSQTQNGSNSSQTHLKNSKWLKMAKTHLKSFNGRQGGILQSISGVSGASGGLKSQNFDFLTQKFKMAQNGSNSSQTQNGSNSS